MSWLSSIFGKIANRRGQPEADFSLTFDEIEIILRDPKGVVHRLGVADLGSVIIETNDTGPFGMDVWWVLLNQDGKPGLIFPQGAIGEKPVADWLMARPGFNHDELIKAMMTTANATHLVWQKSADLAPN